MNSKTTVGTRYSVEEGLLGKELFDFDLEEVEQIGGDLERSSKEKDLTFKEVIMEMDRRRNDKQKEDAEFLDLLQMGNEDEEDQEMSEEKADSDMIKEAVEEDMPS
jgi:hypothetical protein